jgi:hypothetical protein
VLVLAVSAPSTAQDWVGFADETSTRLVSDTSVGATDPLEKDIISGDVDRDGDLDVIVARKTRFSSPGAQPNVLFINELNTMTDRTAALAPDFLTPDDSRDVVLVDVDGDGWLDVVTVTTFGDQPRILMNLGNDMNGDWQGFLHTAADNRLPTFSPGPKFCAVGFGDVTGNGRPDLFFVDYDNSLEDRLLINDGSGFFTDETASRMTPAMSESVFGTDSHILDVNGDGFKDIVKNYSSGNSAPPGTVPSVRVLYNDGTGNFTFMDLIYAPGSGGPYMFEPADWNDDGRPDFYVVDDAQDVYLTNNGNDMNGRATWITTQVTGSPQTQGFGGNVKVGDLDGDGIQDVVVADVDTDLPGCDRRMTVLRGQRSGQTVTYSDPLNGANRAWLPNGTFDIELLDIDKDGNLDLWLGTCDGTMIQMNTTGPGIFVGDFEDGFDRWTDTVGTVLP